eukprot:gene22215-biopygen2717
MARAVIAPPGRAKAVVAGGAESLRVPYSRRIAPFPTRKQYGVLPVQLGVRCGAGTDLVDGALREPEQNDRGNAVAPWHGSPAPLAARRRRGLWELLRGVTAACGARRGGGATASPAALDPAQHTDDWNGCCFGSEAGCVILVQIGARPVMQRYGNALHTQGARTQAAANGALALRCAQQTLRSIYPLSAPAGLPALIELYRRPESSSAANVASEVRPEARRGCPMPGHPALAATRRCCRCTARAVARPYHLVSHQHAVNPPAAGSADCPALSRLPASQRAARLVAHPDAEIPAAAAGEHRAEAPRSVFCTTADAPGHPGAQLHALMVPAPPPLGSTSTENGLPTLTRCLFCHGGAPENELLCLGMVLIQGGGPGTMHGLCSARTTAAPTTSAPTTAAPTSAAPATVAPTTAAPTSAAPATVAPTTAVP